MILHYTMSVISATGVPIGNVTASNIVATGSITADNGFYIIGDGGPDRYYLSNSAPLNDCLYSVPAGNTHQTLLDLVTQLQIRSVTNTNASDIMVIQCNGINAPNNGGYISFTCVGNDGAGNPTQIRPFISNWNTLTNPVPDVNALITYNDLLYFHSTTLAIGSTVGSSGYTNGQNIPNATLTRVGQITLTPGIWTLNVSYGFSCTAVTGDISLQFANIPPLTSNLPSAGTNTQIANPPIYQLLEAGGIQVEQIFQQSSSLTVNIPASVTINLNANCATSGAVTFNPVVGAPDPNFPYFFYAMRIG